MNECQLTYETNGWSYYAQNDQCRSSHQQSVIDRLIDHLFFWMKSFLFSDIVHYAITTSTMRDNHHSHNRSGKH